MGDRFKGQSIFTHSTFFFSRFSPILKIATYAFMEYHDGSFVSLNGNLGLVGCFVTMTQHVGPSNG